MGAEGGGSGRPPCSPHGPDLDFVTVAAGLGVPAARASDAEELTALLERALSSEGPSLVEAAFPPLSGIGR